MHVAGGIYVEHCLLLPSGQHELAYTPMLVIDAHLAQGIPALMPAAGAGAIGIENENQLNWNTMPRPNGWPDHPNYSGRWCHSDMKDVAYFYNFKFYDKAIEKGNLK